MGMMKGFSMLILLLWVPYYDILKLAKITTLITCIIATTLFIAVISNELIEDVVYQYMSNNNAMVIMSHRYFLGVDIFGMYYRSLITFAFLISGTRSTMLLPFALIGLAFYQGARNTKWIKKLIYPMLCVLACCFLLLVYKLATEKGETSNTIK